jgi:hypothetical protein
LELVVDLANMVLYRRARNELMQIKQLKRAPGFKQPHLFRHVMMLLETHHYRLGDRSMVVGLFDKSVLRSIVFGEESDEDGPERGASIKPTQVVAPPPPTVPPRAPGRDRGDSAVAAAIAKHKEQLQQREQQQQEQANLAAQQQRLAAQRRARAQAQAKFPDSDSDEDEEEDDSDEEDEAESSGDEQRTERQRSISDPSELMRDNRG